VFCGCLDGVRRKMEIVGGRRRREEEEEKTVIVPLLNIDIEGAPGTGEEVLPRCV